MSKMVFKFGDGIADGDKSMKAHLGGKGANLAEMCSIGLPVPPGITINTDSCKYYSDNDGKWPEGLEAQIRDGIDHIASQMNAGFGDADNPLLVSVRSGAAVSMPGMMDTVLNLGLNDAAVEGLAKKTGNVRFAYDAYRRFIDMFGDVVMGVHHAYFEEALEALKKDRGVENDVDLSGEDLRVLVDQYKAIYRKHTGYMFPEDPFEQLSLSINAVFGSWDGDRALKYRSINKISGLIGTAVNVQAMVYGNMGPGSGTGVLFTRNPSTGENKLYGEFLVNAQGEDVVAGIRTPEDISQMADEFPAAYERLVEVTQTLEKHYSNIQDIEFTVQEGNLYILQTRNGKRTGAAAVRIAVEMANEGMVSKKEAVRDLVEPGHLDQLLHPRFADVTAYVADVIAKGLPASPGAAVGKVVFSAEHAEKSKEAGEKVLLVRIETSPEDVGGMDAAEGILTSRGGMTSHAAVVARGWGKPCVAGCGEIVINYSNKTFTNGKVTVREGDWISINGSTGEVILGSQKLVDPELTGYFAEFMSWVDEFRTMKVRTNADAPADALQAIEFGAEGIGLCRTEHMFFEGDRIDSVREMILADGLEARKSALAKLLPYQKEDFLGIFKAMEDKPVTVRLLDPPLHEFLPHSEADKRDMAKKMGVSYETVQAKVDSLAEFNPMLGHRGCRLGVTYPEITEMQTRAIIEAAVELTQQGVKVYPEIMVPLIGTVEEFVNQKAVIKATADAVFAEMDAKVDYLIGTMIEIPRAALTADAIAKEAEFFSFGTNDLTQMTFGYSRDDAGTFLPEYVDQKILVEDPFQSLDISGVGQLVRMGTDLGRGSRDGLKVGICGEHGGDPKSVHFCFEVGMDYVSCSPFRVPIARLAAAQASMSE
ncbi:MAG: pyruvate, phosphate dikinase [Bacteroidetes Order II. Incertae sedis bacterium]|jgi:pyruvate, orthophosphate dikinase|nr:pyruvate, phosphate dikinase [Bacteroidetes Order II. bacterium]MBT4051676.1 pyruvate, phosphate dikinase [Bacteroidetes Order II. bacterium]MBT5249657.1 pyruvate, phosphate dikinase [Bacteroidetes Order II. bacterium]MBT6200259.1 pyruvate, phosphate dikinase [Bacteroidetes Order II. bacterium]MBT6424312.1 pyruvate, phosphate dikinase [Bacteroidetes Order II. bacterium]